jgi:hypothetical protein
VTDQVIWKYAFDLNTDVMRFYIPTGAVFLFCGWQHGTMALWFEVNPTAETEARDFFMRGTGHPISVKPQYRRHLGSVKTDEQGTFIFHLYEEVGQ